MTCERCKGLMVEEVEVDFAEFKGVWEYRRCVNCGFQTDPIREANRANAHEIHERTTTPYHKGIGYRGWMK